MYSRLFNCQDLLLVACFSHSCVAVRALLHFSGMFSDASPPRMCCRLQVQTAVTTPPSAILFGQRNRLIWPAQPPCSASPCPAAIHHQLLLLASALSPWWRHLLGQRAFLRRGCARQRENMGPAPMVPCRQLHLLWPASRRQPVAA